MPPTAGAGYRGLKIAREIFTEIVETAIHLQISHPPEILGAYFRLVNQLDIFDIDIVEYIKFHHRRLIADNFDRAVAVGSNMLVEIDIFGANDFIEVIDGNMFYLDGPESGVRTAADNNCKRKQYNNINNNNTHFVSFGSYILYIGMKGQQKRIL